MWIHEDSDQQAQAHGKVVWLLTIMIGTPYECMFSKGNWRASNQEHV